jgi:hypothetical protein
MNRSPSESPDDDAPAAAARGDAPERGRRSGEGAASALAHLKRQARQQRRESPDNDDGQHGAER